MEEEDEEAAVPRRDDRGHEYHYRLYITRTQRMRYPDACHLWVQAMPAPRAAGAAAAKEAPHDAPSAGGPSSESAASPDDASAAGSRVALYFAAAYGYSDMGVNKSRAHALVSFLREKAAKS